MPAPAATNQEPPALEDPARRQPTATTVAASAHRKAPGEEGARREEQVAPEPRVPQRASGPGGRRQSLPNGGNKSDSTSPLAKSASSTHIGRSLATGMSIVPMGQIEQSIQEIERELGNRNVAPLSPAVGKADTVVALETVPVPSLVWQIR